MFEEISELINIAKREGVKSVLTVAAIIGLAALLYNKVIAPEPEEDTELSFVEETQKEKEASKNLKRSPASIKRADSPFANSLEKDLEIKRPMAKPKSSTVSRAVNSFKHNAHQGSYSSGNDDYAQSNPSSSPAPEWRAARTVREYRPNYENSHPSSDSNSLGSDSTETGVNEGEVAETGLTGGGGVILPPNNPTNEEEDVSVSTGGGSTVTNNVGSNQTTPVSNPPSNLSCSSSTPQGTYTTSIGITLTCSEPANIYYCVQMGGGCCDPFTSPTTYSSPISISSAGDYCVSYYAEDVNLVAETDVESLNYSISTSPLNMTVLYPKTQLQTTELALVNQVGSTDFGHPDSYFHQLSLKSHDPGVSGLNWSCPDYLTLFSSLSAPSATALTSDYSVSSLSSSTQIENKIYTDLDYGDNYVVSLLEDRTRNVWSCQVQKIIFQDFQLYEFTNTRLPAGSASNLNYGTFTSFGSFKADGTAVKSGSLEHDQTTQIKQSGILNILY